MPRLPTPPRQPEPGRYHAGRPAPVRRAAPGHPLEYIVRELPAALEALARDLRLAPGARVLDFGCADQPYRHWFDPSIAYTGADLPGNPLADVEIAPDGTVPVADGSVDVVLSTQVLEHVADPGVYLRECFRVLRPGGQLLLSTHGIMIYHPDPVDLWRWTGDGLRRSVEQAGFAVERFEGVMGLTATGLQLLQAGVWPKLPARLRRAFAVVMQRLIALADRLDSPETRRYNALVFALIARKP